MIIHLNPKGLLVMDTCCFVNYCNRNDETKKKGDEVFNYKWTGGDMDRGGQDSVSSFYPI